MELEKQEGAPATCPARLPAEALADDHSRGARAAGQAGAWRAASVARVNPPFLNKKQSLKPPSSPPERTIAANPSVCLYNLEALLYISSTRPIIV